jgi:uncharacterized membrane protein
MTFQRDPLVERYLATFRSGIKGAPHADREEFVRELDSHIAEAQAAGEPVGAILYRLGPPDRLARAYRAELMLSSGNGHFVLRFFAVLGVLITASIPSMIIIPLLLGLGLGGLTTGIVAIVFAAIPALDATFYDGVSSEALNRALGALTGLGLVAGGLAALWGLYLYCLLLIKALRGALSIGAEQ